MGDKLNVILIVCDTLRKDVLDLYGGKASTLELRNLANKLDMEMKWFNGVSNSFWTLPSHYTLFTGLLPSEHKVHEPKDLVSFDYPRYYEELARSYRGSMISLEARKKGYYSIGISNNTGFVNHQFGLSRYFNEFYINPFSFSINVNQGLTDKNALLLHQLSELYNKRFTAIKELLFNKRFNTIFEATKAKLKIWINRYFNHDRIIDKGGYLTLSLIREGSVRLREPFFLFINMMECHEPYRFSKKYNFFTPEVFQQFYLGLMNINKKLLDNLKEDYIKDSEYCLGIISSIIKEISRYTKSFIAIITSDHGQEFGEHGSISHNIGSLYEENIGIPIIIMAPKQVIKDYIQPYYVDLIQVNNLVKSIVSSGSISFINVQGSDYIIVSESYGAEYPSYLEGKELQELYRQRLRVPRKAIYYRNAKVLLNEKEGKVEETLLNGKHAKESSEIKKIIDELSPFINVGDFGKIKF
ncbi:MAG: sulfatase-like hydrolase/transferase [Caldisphaeraceae archaeon]|nr:sulfatase-like hydrolase/transferase [Caldisphaeraceae archaeon]